MSNVTRSRQALSLSRDINNILAELDSSIAKTIDAARSAVLPQGLIVAELHGHAHTHKPTSF
ncbi:hypothetical protein CIB54_22675 [Pseudomonas fluorescens]|uniref:Uncharacterized protein n=1 Tax=Pseudomonas fluorescens TaxID=294 RepID=A0A2N1DXZ6_PSEFL|nr:hypothetical protein [Pseudomonas fluorescens]PKH15700.1 hypothetical protein CIB54_22675 [Pseudomonas fluorescens]